MFTAIIKPAPANIRFIREEDRVRCSKHRAVLVLDDSQPTEWLLEEIKTGLQYLASPKHIVSVKQATKQQLSDVA